MQYTILKLSLKQNDVFFWTSDRGRFGEDMSPQRLAFLYQNLNLAKDSVPGQRGCGGQLLALRGYAHTTERACSGEARCLLLCMHIVVAGAAAHFRARPGVVHIPAQNPGSIAFIVRCT